MNCRLRPGSVPGTRPGAAFAVREEIVPRVPRIPRIPRVPRIPLATVAALACLAPGPAAAQIPAGREPAAREADARVSLRLLPEPGARQEYRHEKRQSLVLPAEAGGDVETRTILRLAREVVAGGADSVVVEWEILGLELEVDPPSPSAPDLGGLRGLRFRAASTPAGRIYRVEVPGASGPVGRPFRERVESWIRELGFPALAPGPVRPGDTWADTTRVPLSALLGLANEVEALEIRTTTLAELEGADGGVARLEVRTAWRNAEDPGDAPDLLIEGSGRLTARFDIARGRFVQATGTSRLRLSVFDGTGAPPRRIEAEGTTETRLEGPAGPGSGSG